MRTLLAYLSGDDACELDSFELSCYDAADTTFRKVDRSEANA
jgi:hypothetical protein